MEINYVSSLGTLCHSAWFLKENKLKECSYPFDWILSSPDSIIHCIENDFNIFLDKSYFINKGKKMTTHSYYTTSKYINTRFMHHNLLDNEDFNYFTRCVDRFRKLLKFKETKLFIITLFRKTCPICGEKHNLLDENIRINYLSEIKSKYFEFNNKFKKFCDSYYLLVIINYPNQKKQSYNMIIQDNIFFLEMYTFSISDGTKFANEIDNIYLKNIINEYFQFNLISL